MMAMSRGRAGPQRSSRHSAALCATTPSARVGHAMDARLESPASLSELAPRRQHPHGGPWWRSRIGAPGRRGLQYAPAAPCATTLLGRFGHAEGAVLEGATSLSELAPLCRHPRGGPRRRWLAGAPGRRGPPDALRYWVRLQRAF
ncbi:hypothetical protein T492DRAFT_1018533, partial [Pavlovales sp. CCMP2436]